MVLKENMKSGTSGANVTSRTPTLNESVVSKPSIANTLNDTEAIGDGGLPSLLNSSSSSRPAIEKQKIGPAQPRTSTVSIAPGSHNLIGDTKTARPQRRS